VFVGVHESEEVSDKMYVGVGEGVLCLCFCKCGIGVFGISPGARRLDFVDVRENFVNVRLRKVR
jgi:hypothetical protein